jgi:hypothetical protein
MTAHDTNATALEREESSKWKREERRKGKKPSAQFVSLCEEHFHILTHSTNLVFHGKW